MGFRVLGFLGFQMGNKDRLWLPSKVKLEKSMLSQSQESTKSFKTPVSTKVDQPKNSRKTLNPAGAAAIILQALVRGAICRIYLSKLKNTVLFIQERFRVIRYNL
jgi:hypothetical protein